MSIVVLVLGLVGTCCLLQTIHRKRNPRLTPSQRQELRRTLHMAEKAAERDAKEARRARTALRSSMRTLAEYQWQAVFYEDTHPGMTANLRQNIPRLEQSIRHYVQQVNNLEASVKLSQLTAASARDSLARYTPKAPREPGLWELLRLCWQGWLVKHGK